MKKMMLMVILVPPENFSTAYEVLSGTGVVLKSEFIDEDTVDVQAQSALDLVTKKSTKSSTAMASTFKHPNGKTSRYVNGKHDKGIEAEDLVSELMSSGRVMSVKEVAREIAKRGFATSTASAVLSKMKVKGTIQHVGSAMYQKTTTKDQTPAKNSGTRT